MLTLQTDSATLTIDPPAGGRIASLEIEGQQVLEGRNTDPLRWGCYPMVPFAGRLRRGRFRFEGVEHLLPINLGPHAIHGFGFTSPWTPISANTIELQIGEPWPFPARVQQQYRLGDSSLDVEMTVHAEARQPLTMGWHPWFVRSLGSGDQLRLDFNATSMYELDEEAIPTGTLVSPPPGPWDNCFTGLVSQPRLRWGDALTLEISSSAEHWVVFDETDHALCVEPQTGPPDSFNIGPSIVEAGRSATVSMSWSWK